MLSALSGPAAGPPILSPLPIGLLIIYLLVEWLVDSMLKGKVRRVHSMVVAYVVLFLAATE